MLMLPPQHLLPHELQCLVVPSCMQPEKLLAAAASSFETLVHLETLDSPVPLLVGEDEAAERRTVASLQLFTGLQSLSLAASRPQSLLLVGRCIPDYMRCMRSLVIAVAVTSNSDMVAIGAGLNCLDPDICSLTLNVTYGKAEEDDEEVLSKESVQAVRSMAGIPSLTALNMKNFRVTQVEQSLRDRSSLKSLCVVDCRMDVPQVRLVAVVLDAEWIWAEHARHRPGEENPLGRFFCPGFLVIIPLLSEFIAFSSGFGPDFHLPSSLLTCVVQLLGFKPSPLSGSALP